MAPGSQLPSKGLRHLRLTPCVSNYGLSLDRQVSHPPPGQPGSVSLHFEDTQRSSVESFHENLKRWTGTQRQ